MGIERLRCSATDSGFFYKNWKRRGIKKFVKKGVHNWFTWSYRKWQTTHIPQLCGAAWLMVQLTNGQHTCELVFKPKAYIWTYVVTVNLFPLYFMNFMFHTMLDAAGIVLIVHYNSMKCDVLFSQGSVRTLFRRGGYFFDTWANKFLHLYNSAKIIKIDRDFPKLRLQMYCHLFYGSQCIYTFPKFVLYVRCITSFWDQNAFKAKCCTCCHPL